jgi:hypothetical protein
MNERIKELMAQADKFAAENKTQTISGLGNNYFELLHEKFAELIVKECAESLWTEECYNSDLALEEFEKNSKKIKEHFGVEE